ncbi:methyltransferase family protein [Paenibacillus donghaensis]|uniref:Isoprenylcysteine carboxyl methyltransferase n=1 Tax=Paenibacillus donghaensis TaxID=414771 RepID=A0A2Z2KH05_9BACL|nr:isoprenylcysteine carboxylmethyltransferase family protein [Paenibacillus donghaensis]ASA22513.1 hypothetical protein B9T62_18025 [Paenibacillus donghaensis]
MSLKNVLSLILFCIFLIAYLSKLVMMYTKNHINANVLANGQKLQKTQHTERFVQFTTLVWGATWFGYAVAESWITPYLAPSLDYPPLYVAGIGVNFVGCLLFIQAMVAMRTSWRVGIDKSSSTTLVTRGVYKYSRNAAFVGFDLMFLGLLLTYPNLLTLGICVVNMAAIHLLILQEEVHLRNAFGAEYIRYSERTPRYLLWW